MQTAQIDETRWQEVLAKGLTTGAHSDFNNGICAMEGAAYIAREPFSDTPKCVSPVIGAFMRSWNDALSNDDRAMILPLIPLTLNTASTPAIEERRSMMAIDWYIREHLPAFLRLAGLTKDADTLAGLSEITAQAQMDGIRAPLEAVRDNASAAWSAARSALSETRTTLQASAYKLVERMCALSADGE